MIKNKLQKIGLIFFIILFLWYTLVFFNIPGLLVAGSVDLFSLLSLLELFLVIILVGYFFRWKYTDYFNLFILSIWGYLQYAAHWRYLLFEPSEEILDRYYHYFEGTLRFFAQSQTRIVPDAYHTILGILIYLNLVLVILKIIFSLKNSGKEKVKTDST
jgi:hypothetical protein